jgi:hypothetical protein
VKVAPVLRHPLTSSDIEKKTISKIEMAEILSSSRKLRSPLDRQVSQHKTMLFENSELFTGTSQPSILRNGNYAAEYEPLKQLQCEAKARFLIPHSAKSLAGYFLVVL